VRATARHGARGGGPDAAAVLADVTALLRSGMDPSRAWAAAGVEVDAEGLPRVDRLGGDAVAARCALAGSRLAREVGAPLARVLMAVDEALARVAVARDAAEAALAGPRMSAQILRWLPLVGVGLAALVDPRAVRTLVMSPAGWVLAAAAAGLTWGGARWMARMVRAAGGPGMADARAEIPVAVTCALVDAALGTGMPVSDACRRVAGVVDEHGGRALVELADALDRAAGDGPATPGPWGGGTARGARRRGTSRPAARFARRERRGSDSAPHTVLGALRRPLTLAVETGAPARPGIAAATARLDRDERRRAQRAAGELGVRLTLPLALCLLPAFALAGVVPMVYAVVAGAGLGDLGGVLDLDLDVPAPAP